MENNSTDRPQLEDILEASDLFDAFENRAAGYLGERPRLSVRDCIAADTAALAAARSAGLDDDDLEAWANSREGRWYGDCFGTATAERYLPGAGR